MKGSNKMSILLRRSSFVRSSMRGVRQLSFIIVGDQEAFTKLESNDKKKIFYFTASWCPPCRMIGPIFEKMAADHPTVDFCKVDVDELPDAAGAYKVSGVPMFVFSNGVTKVHEITGADENGIRAGVNALEAL